MGVVVVGSTNLDYLLDVAELPALGETVLATALTKQPGGKGANQAVAAARMGARVTFVGCVGNDDDGTLMLRQLRAEGIDTSEVEVLGAHSSGLAIVYVVRNGDNSIAVVPGANSQLSATRVRRVVSSRASRGSVVVVQQEIPADAVRAAVAAADASGARVILNAAPAGGPAHELLGLCDPLVVNENEAGHLVGSAVNDRAAALRAADELARRARSVVITLGADGAVWSDGRRASHVPAPAVADVADTAGAGDAFVGVLATVLADGEGLGAAVEAGVLAGSYAVAHTGAQSSYPRREDLAIPA